MFKRLFFFGVTMYNVVVLGLISKSRFESFRNDVLNLIRAELTGLTATNPLVDPLDLVVKGEYPVLANLVRLVFHDCAGLNDKNVSICNGCIDLNNGDNNAFEEGSIGPMQSICANYSDGISLADCWILAATFGLELAVNQSVTSLAALGVKIEPALKRGDIPYYYGRKDCSSAPQNSANFPEETFPEELFYWEETEKFMKERFPGWNNKEIVVLIAGGHSLGRAHANLTQYAGPWDITPAGLDNLYFKNLLNNDNSLILNGTFYQGKIRSDLNVQWFNKLSDIYVEQFKLPQNKIGLMLNSDISMAFDLSLYSKKNNRENIDCVTNAIQICPTDSTILIANNGENNNNNSQVLFNSKSKKICQYRQCPIQCPKNNDIVITYNDLFSQNKHLNPILGNKISKLSPNSKCTAAWILQYSKDNSLFVKDFANAWKKLITTGYRNRLGNVMLNKIN